MALPAAPLAIGADAAHEVVVHVDHFRQPARSLDRAAVRAFRRPAASVSVAEMTAVPLRRPYAGVAAGALVAVWSSWDTIEIAVRDGSAAARLGVGRGAPVTVTAG
ncbi:MAG: SAM hydroxide adenosyltransferase [Candidatus Binatia bacterium]